MKKMMITTIILCVSQGCVAQWDYPAVPKQDPDTCEWQTKYVYWPVDNRQVNCQKEKIKVEDKDGT